MPDENGVIVTTTQMYALLLDMNKTLGEVRLETSSGAVTIRDHETRIREIEQREDLTRRVAEIEAAMAKQSAQIDGLKRLLYAIPSVAVLTAIVAIVVSLSDKF